MSEEKSEIKKYTEALAELIDNLPSPLGLLVVNVSIQMNSTTDVHGGLTHTFTTNITPKFP